MASEPGADSPTTPARERGLARGPRLALRALLLGGIALTVVHLLRAAPREITVHVELGAARQGLRAATLEYRRGGDLARSVTFNYPDTAPSVQRHEARVPPGDYRLDLTLVYDGRTRRLTRRFRAGEDEVVRLDVGGP
jgi:hypothetical protein